MTMKGVSFALTVLVVVIVVLIVALIVLSIFAGGIQNVGTIISQILPGAGAQKCEDIGGFCKTACEPGETINFAGSCPTGQICCVSAG